MGEIVICKERLTMEICEKLYGRHKQLVRQTELGIEYHDINSGITFVLPEYVAFDRHHDPIDPLAFSVYGGTDMAGMLQLTPMPLLLSSLFGHYQVLLDGAVPKPYFFLPEPDDAKSIKMDVLVSATWSELEGVSMIDWGSNLYNLRPDRCERMHLPRLAYTAVDDACAMISGDCYWVLQDVGMTVAIQTLWSRYQHHSLRILQNEAAVLEQEKVCKGELKTEVRKALETFEEAHEGWETDIGEHTILLEEPGYGGVTIVHKLPLSRQGLQKLRNTNYNSGNK